MAETTLADLIERVADRFGAYRQGTATGGSTTTVVDTADLIEPDEQWVNAYAYILTDAGGAHAAPEGEERLVTAYDQAEATVTVDPAFTASVASSDTYELLPTRREVLTRAINRAVRAAGGTWLVPTVDDSTVDLADDDYDYDLPTDLVRLWGVWTRGDTDEPWERVPGRLWEVMGTPGAQELVFQSLQDLSADDTIRLEYGARPSALSADDDTLGIGEPAEADFVSFIEEYALYWLHDRAKRVGGGDFRRHLTEAQTCFERAMGIQGRARGFGPAGTVATPRWSRAR